MVRLAGLEPARLASRDFLTTIVFTTGICRLWSGLYLHHSISALGACRLVSTPSWYFYQAWLGISMLKPSPNLTGSAPTVSSRALKLSISPLRLPITPQSQLISLIFRNFHLLLLNLLQLMLVLLYHIFYMLSIIHYH